MSQRKKISKTLYWIFTFRINVFFLALLSCLLLTQLTPYISECYGFETDKSFINKEDNWYKLQASYELGFLDILSHKIQFGSNGSVFDYVKEGGQEVLFPFSRITAEINMSKRHNLIFLIQPFDIRTKALLERDIVVNGIAFKKNTPIDLRYGFTYYRLSYLYDFWKADDRELGIGLSFQLRNATIDFASSDGTTLSSNRNVGPVPIFKFRFRYPFSNGLWIGGEMDGFYASGKYITGSSNDFEGAILDASLRTGFELTDYLDGFLNVRYIGGGAKGTEKNPSGPGDGFTDNWLKTMEISVGFYLR
jgi:hypothetical protein